MEGQCALPSLLAFQMRVLQNNQSAMVGCLGAACMGLQHYHNLLMMHISTPSPDGLIIHSPLLFLIILLIKVFRAWPRASYFSSLVLSCFNQMPAHTCLPFNFLVFFFLVVGPFLPWAFCLESMPYTVPCIESLLMLSLGSIFSSFRLFACHSTESFSSWIHSNIMACSGLDS